MGGSRRLRLQRREIPVKSDHLSLDFCSDITIVLKGLKNTYQAKNQTDSEVLFRHQAARGLPRLALANQAKTMSLSTGTAIKLDLELTLKLVEEHLL